MFTLIIEMILPDISRVSRMISEVTISSLGKDESPQKTDRIVKTTTFYFLRKAYFNRILH